MAYSKTQLNWKMLRWLIRRENSLDKSTVGVVLTLSSNTEEFLELINQTRCSDQALNWADFCMLVDLAVIILIHAQAGCDTAKETLYNIVLSKDKAFILFAISSLQTKFNTR